MRFSQLIRLSQFIISLYTLGVFSVASVSAAPVLAIITKNGKGIQEDEVIQSNKSEILQVIDRANVRYELGPGSSAYFDSNRRFRLLRGSVVMDSQDWRTMKTANAQLEYFGKTIVSYDYRERSTSAFVVRGKARLRHEAYTDRVQNLLNAEGATIVSGGFYPTWLKSLQFTEITTWLRRYEWPANRRLSLLAGLQLKRGDLHDKNRSSRNAAATAELRAYFPGQPGQARDLVREKYTSSELRGKAHTSVERAALNRDKIEFLRPEEAATMILPKIEIRPQITAFPEKDRYKSRNLAALEKVDRFERKSNKPKKVVKVYIKEKQPYEHIKDPAVRSALSRLDLVAKWKARTREDELRNRYYDQLQENF